MSHSRCRPVTLVGLSLATLALALLPGITARPVAAVGQWSVFATDLQNPRGLRFGPDGNPTSPKEVQVVSTRPMVSAIRSSLR